MFIAVAGRSNGLGPVLSGNAVWPVINCPPVKADWGAEDIWSSLRMPSGAFKIYPLPLSINLFWVFFHPDAGQNT